MYKQKRQGWKIDNQDVKYVLPVLTEFFAVHIIGRVLSVMLCTSVYSSVHSVLIWCVNQFHSISFKYCSPCIQQSGIYCKEAKKILNSIVIRLQALNLQSPPM